MGNIRLLDCTLRDGGYINDWDFGKRVIEDTIAKLEDSGVDILEIGFLKDQEYDEDRTVYNNMKQITNQIIPKRQSIQYAAMIEVVDPIPLEQLNPCDEKTVDIIRVIVWKRLLNEGFEYCKSIVEKGYKLCVQPARVDQYSENEFIEMIKLFNKLKPLAIYIVDSWGTQNQESLLKYIHLADEYMEPNIAVGYHGHNNLMQAFGVAEAFIKTNIERDKIIDSSVYGIGRGAGNLNTELMINYMNSKLGKNYQIEPIIDIYSKYIKSIYSKTPWGYSYGYYLTALYNCNPNYGEFYEKHKGVSYEEINEVLSSLPSEDKIIFSEDKAKYYLEQYRKCKLKKSLCVIVPTCNRSAGIEFYISVAGETFKQHGIDLIIYDSSSDDSTKKIVEKYNLPNVIYKRYIEDKNDKTLDAKVFSAAKQYLNEYEYIWICRDRSIPNIETIYEKLNKMIVQKYDFIVVYPHYISYQHHGFCEYDDCKLLFNELCGEMTSLGSTIFSSDLLKKLVLGYPIDADKNYGLWIPMALFEYIGTNAFRAMYLIDNSFIYVPGYTTSFWIKSNTLLWLWSERWSKMVTLLPDIYNDEKPDVIKFRNWTIKPFSPLLVLPSRAGGGFKVRDVYTYRKYIPKVTEASLWQFYIIALLPANFVKLLLEKPNSILVRVLKSIYKKILHPMRKGLQCLRNDIYTFACKKTKQSFSGTNYEENINCFAKNEHIKSILLYGDLSNVKKPWITIAVPTYKRVNLIGDALNSILNQWDVDFEWEIIIVDNEPYEGEANKTQLFIESFDDSRILYYRNEENLGVGGNLNRCVELARGEWIAFLHDDDILVYDYLRKIERRIRLFSNKKGKPLGYISGTPEIFVGGSLKEDTNNRINVLMKNYALCAKKDNGKMLRVRQAEIAVTGQVGVVAPTTGTIIKRAAIFENGGYNEEQSISADLILAYKIMNKYKVYRNSDVLGFYRWYDNVSESKLLQIEKDLFDFREYAYKKNIFYKIFSAFRQEHFANEVSGLILMSQKTYNDNEFHKFEDIMKYYPNNVRRSSYKVSMKIYRAIQKSLAIKCNKN